jgi:hypothetical protein
MFIPTAIDVVDPKKLERHLSTARAARRSIRVVRQCVDA